MITNYDFSSLRESISDIACSVRDGEYDVNVNNSNRSFTNRNNIDKYCSNIRMELNKIFEDTKCNGVIYTNNTDCEFFGIIVKPMGDYVYKLTSEDVEPETHFCNYVIEFDSKLFTSPVEISSSEIMALLLYDIDILSSSTTFRDIRDTINAAANGLSMNPSSVINDRTKALFQYCVYETLHKMFGICESPSYELNLASEFIRAIGLEESFDSAFDKIQSLRSDMEKNNTCITLAINWFFYTMKDFSMYNRTHVYTLRHALEVTGSSLFKSLINSSLNALDMPSNVYVSESKKGFISSMKANGMKSLEDDIFEYSMRIKNIDDESSAILLMRQINSRMGIIADYLDSEDLADFERKRWEKLYERYDKLREEMVKKPIYSRKMYGLFVDYNALMNMSATNQMTMDTMY